MSNLARSAVSAFDFRIPRGEATARRRDCTSVLRDSMVVDTTFVAAMAAFAAPTAGPSVHVRDDWRGGVAALVTPRGLPA